MIYTVRSPSYLQRLHLHREQPDSILHHVRAACTRRSTLPMREVLSEQTHDIPVGRSVIDRVNSQLQHPTSTTAVTQSRPAAAHAKRCCDSMKIATMRTQRDRHTMHCTTRPHDARAAASSSAAALSPAPAAPPVPPALLLLLLSISAFYALYVVLCPGADSERLCSRDGLD